MIVIGLKIFDGQPLPSLPFGVTLNTLLALFTTMTKAAFVFPVAEALSQWKWNRLREARPLVEMETFDSASRGVWGSLFLIGSIRWK